MEKEGVGPTCRKQPTLAMAVAPEPTYHLAGEAATVVNGDSSDLLPLTTTVATYCRLRGRLVYKFEKLSFRH
jgi:hypothetical protein